jgi:hypothetical protein
MKPLAWRLPLQELPKSAAWLLLFVAPVMAGLMSLLGGVLAGTVVFELVLPYILLVGGLSGALEIRASKRIRIGGLGDMGLVVFRSTYVAGVLIVAGLMAGVIAGTIIANVGVDVRFGH